MSTAHSSIDQHPDLLALRAGYERASESVSAHTTFGFTALTALYVALSPWIIGFDGTTRLMVNDLIVGLTVLVMAFAFGSALDRTHGMTWTVPVAGAWLIICPWILHDMSPTAGMIWSNVVAGALVFVLGLIAAYFGRHQAATR